MNFVKLGGGNTSSYKILTFLFAVLFPSITSATTKGTTRSSLEPYIYHPVDISGQDKKLIKAIESMPSTLTFMFQNILTETTEDTIHLMLIAIVIKVDSPEKLLNEFKAELKDTVSLNPLTIQSENESLLKNAPFTEREFKAYSLIMQRHASNHHVWLTKCLENACEPCLETENTYYGTISVGIKRLLVIQ